MDMNGTYNTSYDDAATENSTTYQVLNKKIS